MTTDHVLVCYWKERKAAEREQKKKVQQLWIDTLKARGMELEFMRGTGIGQFLVTNPAKPAMPAVIHVLAIPSKNRWVIRYRTKFFQSREAFDLFFAGKPMPESCAVTGEMTSTFHTLDALIDYLETGETP